MKTANKKAALKINGGSSFIRNKGDLLFYVLLLLIPITQIAIFYFGVNFQNILMSFQTYSTSENTFYWDAAANFNRFAKELKDPNFWLMIKDSFIVWIFTQLAGTVLALFFSYYIFKKRKLYNFFKFVLFLPSIIPGLLLVLIFQSFANNALPAFLEHIGTTLKPILTDSKNYFTVVTVFTIWVGFGSQVLVYSGAMNQIPDSMLEAGKLDGASSFTEFIQLVVPYIMPTVATFIIAGIATIFTNQNNLFSFYGSSLPGADKTIGYYLYYLVDASGQGMSNYCYASFLGLISTCVAAPLTLLVRRSLRKVGEK
ncbi:MAG: sugar ABC transporter permease [Bacilli bacterium]|nr:sugar ABC transporter permease [Bacilli bacterium]